MVGFHRRLRVVKNKVRQVWTIFPRSKRVLLSFYLLGEQGVFSRMYKNEIGQLPMELSTILLQFCNPREGTWAYEIELIQLFVTCKQLWGVDRPNRNKCNKTNIMPRNFLIECSNIQTPCREVIICEWFSDNSVSCNCKI